MVGTMVRSSYQCFLLTLLLLCLFALRPAIAKESWASWPAVGQAEFTWFWFDVYRSTLRTPDGHFHGLSTDLVLEIEYQRQISAEQLLDATEQQWVAMGYSTQSIQDWLALLKPLFPSVAANDTLYFVAHLEQGSLYFAPQGQAPKLLGEVDDGNLCQAFLSIWLGPRTQYPKLRKQLIGESR